MTRPPTSIALIGQDNPQPHAQAILETVNQILIRQNVKRFLEINTSQYTSIQNAHITSYADIVAQNTDLAILCGGDGTMLQAMRLFCGSKTPLVGINTGRIGFLTDIAHDYIERDLSSILQGLGITEQRVLLKGQIINDANVINEGIAANDIYLNKGASGRIGDFDLYINNQLAHSVRSDGLIVSTPTGSTAYSLSAGGNIIHPEARCLVITPLNPHPFTSRPLVVSDDSTIIIYNKSKQVQVHLDGQQHAEIGQQSSLLITKFHQKILLVHPPHYRYFSALHTKLYGR